MQNKNIVVGVTGGIAAYKTAELIRLLRNRGANVRVVMTKNAQEFITPLALQTLAANTVYTDTCNQGLSFDLEHISLARFADIIVIAPATANTIAKLAYGIADNLLTSVCLATTSPIAIVPAMNKEMWNADITRENITKLKKRGFFIFGPADGVQACGEVGLGRMLEPVQILNLINDAFSSNIFYGKKFVITAGPTQEAIDPVRYLGNYSSGKMGYALAIAAQEAGADVTLISGPTNLPCPQKIKYIAVQTAKEMDKVVMQKISGCDVFICAAAVADYRPKSYSPQKIKKESFEKSLKLQRNPDILAKVASLEPKIRPFVVGFAAETESLLKHAKEKLKSKKLDMIVANKVGNNLGFGSDENSVTILRKNNTAVALQKNTKTKLAKQIIKIIYKAMSDKKWCD